MKITSITILFLLIFTFGRVAISSADNPPSVSARRICDLDKATGSAFTVTNTSGATSTAHTIFYSQGNTFLGLDSQAILAGGTVAYNTLPAFLPNSYLGWALVSDGPFSATISSGPGAIHSADFLPNVLPNLNLVFVDLLITGNNCYDNFTFDWGDGSAVETHPKGTTNLFHGYPNLSEVYTATITTYLGSGKIVSHTETIEINLPPPTAVTIVQAHTQTMVTPIFGIFLILLGGLVIIFAIKMKKKLP